MAATTEFDSTTIFWIVLLFSITFGYVGTSTLPIGLVMLLIIYIISWGYLSRWIYQNLNFIKELVIKSDTSPANFITKIFFGISITILLLSILYGGTSLTKTNVGTMWGIVLFIWGSIIISILGIKDIVGPSIAFYGLFLIFAVMIVWNLTNMIMVTNAVVKKSNVLKTYNFGNLSKQTKTDITTFEALFYTSTFSLIAAACLMILPDNVGKKNILMIAPTTSLYKWSSITLFLTALSTTVGNYFVSKDLIYKLPNESVTIPTKSDTDTSEEKVQNQNVFSTTYYSILRFFKDPSIM